MVGEGEKKASIEAVIMEIEFTRNRKLVGFILAIDVLQKIAGDLLAAFLFLLRIYQGFPPNGPNSKCPSATESATSYLDCSHQ
jgi:hypothetical protein